MARRVLIRSASTEHWLISSWLKPFFNNRYSRLLLEMRSFDCERRLGRSLSKASISALIILWGYISVESGGPPETAGLSPSVIGNSTISILWNWTFLLHFLEREALAMFLVGHILETLDCRSSTNYWARFVGPQGFIYFCEQAYAGKIIKAQTSHATAYRYIVSCSVPAFCPAQYWYLAWSWRDWVSPSTKQAQKIILHSLLHHLR